MKDTEQLNVLAAEFRECQHVLTAIGDPTRQSILLTLIAAGCKDGMRVGEITQKTHLSRPTVSHHLRILKEAKVVNVHRVGTKNFYYIDPQHNSLFLLKNMMNHIEEYIQNHWEEEKG
ncbi:metalloregulator ArsR/SmtB family transcription factor [Gracilibacillus salinarum]|uniref:Metalloregulator ArsR/SmtB family transcription factor n=1 Tax=Gracilibacillus salinarum TaxID=2932255 RepID=A0ABY4GR66_9BACI|nr:metalloregulator ArsR/SmtB family transcription factor [Gracilibacillus salinarum]UOQ86891.1 metalloregulator ArsR/SmtB family transcription factor [Gracilibacillus salinarum]